MKQKIIIEDTQYSFDCKDIFIKIGHSKLICEFSYTFQPNTSYAIIGPNGCGKTTLLKAMAGLTPIWKGNITFSDHAKFSTLFLSNQPSFLLDQSVISNFEYYVKSYHKKWDLPQINEALEKVGLNQRQSQSTRTLSTGQKRRLSLAIASYLKPSLLLADEPSNGLDALGVQLCLETFSQLQKEEQSTIITATHDERLLQWSSNSIDLMNYKPKSSKQNTSRLSIQNLLQ